MRALILIVVTSLLVIIGAGIHLEELNYGDIIAFPRTELCGCFPFTYKHYGIFLDKKRFPEQNDDDNIFHFTGPLSTKTLSGCIFDKIKPGVNIERDNYLDDIQLFKDHKIITEGGITSRITKMYNKCKMWTPSNNNCEHLSTYVRYGLKISLQCNQDAAKIVKNPGIYKPLLKEIKAQLEYVGIVKDMELDLDISENIFCDGSCNVGKGTN